MLAVAYGPAPPSILHLCRHARHSFDSAFTGRFDADKYTVLQEHTTENDEILIKVLVHPGIPQAL
jgi:hypothetical protein